MDMAEINPWQETRAQIFAFITDALAPLHGHGFKVHVFPDHSVGGEVYWGAHVRNDVGDLIFSANGRAQE